MNILFICTGNTCRSPMAEGYLDSKQLPSLKTESRGLSASGDPVSENSVKAMREAGIDISGDISRQLEISDLALADKILYMSPSHCTVLRLYAPESKLFLLGEGISDPYGGDLEDYRRCRNQIFAAIDRLIEEDFFLETQVVRATAEDIPQIALLEQQCFSAPWSQKTLLEAMERGTEFFIAKKGDKALGYAGISAVCDEGYITNIAVSQGARRKGLGKALLSRIIAYAKDQGLSFVSLEVRESNAPAISLYEGFDFKPEGRRKGFYDNPKEDGLIFTKRF